MFCVTSVKAPAALQQRRGPSRASAKCAALGFALPHVAPPQIIEGENGLGIALEGFDARKLHRVETVRDPLAGLVAETCRGRSRPKRRRR